MTIAHLPAPTWSQRLPPITVDCRAALSGIVASRSSTSAARDSAAADLDRMTMRPGFWPAMADVFHEIYGEPA